LFTHRSIVLPIWTRPQPASRFMLSISQTSRVVDLFVSFFFWGGASACGLAIWSWPKSRHRETDYISRL